MEKTVAIHRVRKRFGPVEAVRDISFVVHPGEIFGLLGPNGAGKTTTIRMLLDILRPDAGEIAVFGGALTQAGKDRIGYLPEERGLYAQLKLLDVIVYLGSLKGLRRREARARAEPLLQRLGLWEQRKKKLSELSRGMHQKAQFIVTILHDPDLIIVDEPFAGLDPVNTQLIQEMIGELRTDGKSIIMSTHQLHQVEALCERLVLIHQGVVRLSGSVRAVREQFAGNEVLVEGAGPIDQAPGVVAARRHNGQWRLSLADDLDPASFLPQLVGVEGVRVTHYAAALPSLSEIFIRIVGNEGADA
jgi:ABC-2 type transport system ATP-binding protein